MKTYRRNPKHRELENDVRSQRSRQTNEESDGQQDQKSAVQDGEEVRQG